MEITTIDLIQTCTAYIIAVALVLMFLFSNKKEKNFFVTGYGTAFYLLTLLNWGVSFMIHYFQGMSVSDGLVHFPCCVALIGANVCHTIFIFLVFIGFIIFMLTGLWQLVSPKSWKDKIDENKKSSD